MLKLAFRKSNLCNPNTVQSWNCVNLFKSLAITSKKVIFRIWRFCISICMVFICCSYIWFWKFSENEELAKLYSESLKNVADQVLQSITSIICSTDTSDPRLVQCLTCVRVRHLWTHDTTLAYVIAFKYVNFLITTTSVVCPVSLSALVFIASIFIRILELFLVGVFVNFI